MDTRKTELPREKRISDHKRNRQLATIIQNTNRWMDVLFHELNGFLGNVTWITQMMQNETKLTEGLPEGTLGELNRMTLENVYTLKTVYHYFQAMNAVANLDNEPGEEVVINEAMLLSAVPKIADEEVWYNGLMLKASAPFAKVLTFLLNRMLEVSTQAGPDEKRLCIAFNAGQEALNIRVSSTALFWHHELSEQRPAGRPGAMLPHPSLWAREMFYEMLALVDGQIMSGCSAQRDFATARRRPRLAAELVQREISPQHFAFFLPLELGRT